MRILILMLVAYGALSAPIAGQVGANPAPVSLVRSVCVDSDGDGVSDCDGDCDDANAACTVDCTDNDGDGFCPPFDCDDATFDADDGDGDHIPDGCDNCPTVANTDQVDRDGFAPEQIFDQSTGTFQALTLADLDRDGDLDVATGDADSVFWQEYDAVQGGFLPEQLLVSSPAVHGRLGCVHPA